MKSIKTFSTSGLFVLLLSPLFKICKHLKNISKAGVTMEERYM